MLSWKWKCSIVCNSWGPHGLYSPWNSLGQNTGVGSHSLLQGTFPTQGLNPGLPKCRQILYQLSHQGSPRIMERVVYPFSSRSSWPRNQTRVSALQADSLLSELPRKPLEVKGSLSVFMYMFFYPSLLTQVLCVICFSYKQQMIRLHFLPKSKIF